MRTHGRGRVTGPVVAVAVMILAALAAGCSAEVEGMSDSAGIAASESEARAPDAVAGQRDGGVSAGDVAGLKTGSANRPVVQTRAVIRKGEIWLVAKEMNRARGEIDDLLAAHGGYLSSEDTENDRAGRPERSTLVMRVPEPAFATVMAELAEIGRAEHAERSSDDVTTQVIDVDTRVATQEASLARLQRFLRAATTVEDMIRLESEIATRQASLESLKAQQKYLSDQTSMSTITVRLRTPAAPPPPRAEDETGFLAGLEDGWNALTTVLVGAATVTGALLPFVVAFALLGVPTWLLLRTATRRRRQTAPLTPPTPDAG